MSETIHDVSHQFDPSLAMVCMTVSLVLYAKFILFRNHVRIGIKLLGKFNDISEYTRLHL